MTLTLIYLLTHQSQSICNFIYISEYPYQLDVCHYNTPTYSYGYYCTYSYNGTTYSDQQVLELYFPSPDCPGGVDSEDAIVTNQYVCADEDCHCDGTPADCTISTERYYDFNPIFIDESTNNPGCNASNWREFQYAWKDVCISKINVDSFGWTCSEEYGTNRVLYDDQSCSTQASIVGTPSPTLDNPCYIYSCDGDIDLPSWDYGYTGTEESDGTVGIVIGVVIAVIVCCLCIVAIWCCIQRKQKKEVTFDHNTTSGQTW